MVNVDLVKNLFVPFIVEKYGLDSLLNATGLSERDMSKILFQDECSKSIDESCINTDCHYNYIEMHNDDMYVDLMKEIQDERLRLKK